MSVELRRKKLEGGKFSLLSRGPPTTAVFPSDDKDTETP